MLEFSPDWDARWCYLVVLGCAVLSARLQIYGRLDILKAKTIYAWGLYSTWLIFSVYLFIPVALFWFLDRTGALHDTAVFGALLTGLAYPAILSGGTNLKPTALAGIFGWLNRTTDALVAKTLALVDLEGRIFERAIVKHIAANPAAFSQVEQLALEYTADPEAMKKELADDSLDRSAQAGVVYDYATNSVQGLKPLSALLPRLGIKPPIRSPYLAARRWAWTYGGAGIAAALVLMVMIFSPWGNRQYLVWRICKPGATAVDIQRSRNRLRSQIATAKGDDRRTIENALAYALQDPAIDVRRAEEILTILLQFRGDRKDGDFLPLARLLTDALRVSSVDVRARVNHSLLLLAAEFKDGDQAALQALHDWQPLANESLIDLESKWREWNSWWTLAALGGGNGQSVAAAAGSRPPSPP